MATAREVIKDALEDILEAGGDEPIEADQINDGIRYLNDMMLSWDAEGISLGFTKITRISEILTVPDGAIRGIKAHLSIELAPKYAAEVTAGLTRRASKGLAAILNLIGGMATKSYPSTLPLGSGNAVAGEMQFYPESANSILTETGGSIALEIDTEEADD